MCMCVCAAMAEGRRLQRLLFASFSALEKMVFSERLTKVLGTFSSPSSSPSAFPHTRVGTGLAGAPVSSGAVDKGGQLTASCRSVCLDSSGRTASGRESYFSRLFVIALLDFCKVVKRVNNQNTSEGVSLLCV